MAAPDPMKHLWKEYNKLKNWLGSLDTASRIFIDQTREDEIEMPSSGPNNGGANSGIQGKHMRIVGLIFPSTAPFRQLGLKVEILMPAGYPREPPVVYMRTDNIRHPNIEKDGRICTTLLDPAKKWNAAPLPDVVKMVVKLMEEPERGHVVDAEMGSLYDTDINKYNETIKEMVTRHGERP